MTMRLRVRVVAEVVDQVAPADVEHRADRDERAEADVLAAGSSRGSPCSSAPLWLMKPTLPGRAMAAAKVAFRPGKRAHHAQAVRAR